MGWYQRETSQLPSFTSDEASSGPASLRQLVRTTAGQTVNDMHLISTWGSIAIDSAGSRVLARLRLLNKSVSDRGEQKGWTERELSGEG
eukprot:422001-Rhodomonas_salina.1